MADTQHIQRAELTKEAQDTATVVALLNLKLIQAQNEAATARGAYKSALEDTPEWNEADAIRCEIRNATEERRKEMRELLKKARAQVDGTAAVRSREYAAGIKHRISAELSNGGQQLMPFMRLID